MSSGAMSPTRLMQKTPNPYWGMVKKNTIQGAVYRQGEQSPPGLEGGFPTFVYAEFPTIAPSDTQDLTLYVPDDFTLLGYLGSAVHLDGGGFSFQVYDADRDIWLNDRLINFQCLAGTGRAPLIEREPYDFKPDKPQVLLRVANHSTSQNDIQFALYGIVGGSKE